MQANKRSIAAIFALPLLLASSGCDKKSDTEGDTKTEEKPKVEKKELSTLFTSDKPTLPPPFGALKLGMSEEEGKKAVPAMDDGDIKSEEYPEVWFKADFDDKTKKLNRVYFNLPKDEAVKLMTAQWGAPQKGTDLGKEVLWWFNPEAELRASLADSFSEGEAHVEFTHYLPLAKFLGEGPEIAFQKDAPLLGLSVADLEAKYGPYVKKESEEEAKKNQEEIKKMAGEEAGALMGKPKASVDLEYPPTEWGKYWTPVNLSWSDDGKIERAWFGIDFEPNPAAKDEIMAFLKKKWGEPKAEKEKYGDGTVYVFSEEPFIKVEEDTISGKWDIYIEPKRS